MRRGLALFSLAALAACDQPRKELFSAECKDGTRVAGARDVAESRCARRGGLQTLTPLDEEPQAPARNDHSSRTHP